MEKVLTTFKQVKDYTDKNAPGRDWNLGHRDGDQAAKPACS